MAWSFGQKTEDTSQEDDKRSWNNADGLGQGRGYFARNTPREGFPIGSEAS